MNMGDIIFQVFMFLFMIASISAVFLLIQALVIAKNPMNNEQKLDKIIELLEKNKSVD